jgi:tRNA A64-2'-O-ribosylphosphate transferase
LSTSKQDLPEVIERLKASAPGNEVKLNSTHLAAVTEVTPGSGLFLGVASGVEPMTGWLVLQLSRRTTEEMPDPSTCEDRLFYRIPRSKKGELYYVSTVLPACAEAATKAMAEGKQVVVVDDDGKDVAVGIMVALSWLLVDDDGNKRQGPAPTGEPRLKLAGEESTDLFATATKADTRTRLQWILDKRPGANPSRSTLQRVNEFLMSPPRP